MAAWRADRQPHGRSLASDPHGREKCHYDDGSIIDHANLTVPPIVKF
jgi:hypothetical protein